ncbi:MAG: hypothetical protein MUP30_09510 [Deltaproteobacteria bacterium]|nr:hypothetical protein [Deltaproteobacteria bacterium]
MLEIIFFETLRMGIPIIVQIVGEDIWKKLRPPIERARRKAVLKMARELGDEFPSVNFLEMNFRFDSKAMRDELNKLTTGEEMPDENILIKEMVKEISQQFPKYSDRAEKIVRSFLKHLQQECLAYNELQGVVLASIVRRESTATRYFIHEEGEKQKREIIENIKKITSELAPKNIIQEEKISRITSALEKRLVEDRDKIIELIKKWQSQGLLQRIQRLADEALELRESVSPEISGSIFRLCGSFILRSSRNIEKSKKWIALADKVDPYNHKTIALRAELLGYEKRWGDAEKILRPIADKTDSAFVKIIYAESLVHVQDVPNAFEWLNAQGETKDDKEIKLNLAIFAAKNDQNDYALDLLSELKKNPYPGPYPYLLTAEILIKQAAPRDLFSISQVEDYELQKNDNLLMQAINDLERGIELLELTARPIDEVTQVALGLSDLYLKVGDLDSAEKCLCKYWKNLRNEMIPWVSASTVAFLKGQRRKALSRAQRILRFFNRGDYEPLFRYASQCMNIEEWDKCLEIIDSIDETKLDELHSKAIIEIKIICQTQQKDFNSAEGSIKNLKDKFPKYDMWIIYNAMLLAQQEKIGDAIDLLVRERKNFPESLKIKLRLASLYRQNGQFRDALPLYRELADFLLNIRSYENACKVAFEAENADEVLSIIKEAFLKGINSENLKHFKAVALTQKEQYEDALKLFSSFSRKSLSHNDYIFNAVCYANRANPNGAIDLLKEARTKYPDDIRIVRFLFSVYLEANKAKEAFEQANIWLEKDPEDKGAYFAVITTGFAIGEQEAANKTLVNYLSRFGEGPELRGTTIEQIKEIQKNTAERVDLLWDKYQNGLMPEIILSQPSVLGAGGTRIKFLESNIKVMAFNGSPEAQKRQLINTVIAENILIDYHALITICLLGLFEPTFKFLQQLSIPDIVLLKLREDIVKLSTSYQRDRREIQDRVFSKVKESFTINEAFPSIKSKEIFKILGNTSYDLLTCNKRNCLYLMPCYEDREISEIRKQFGADPISVLDFVDMMQEKGIISIADHATAAETLGKYKMKRVSKLTYFPSNIMIHWSAMEMLEECDLLQRIIKSAKEIHIGPFSYAVLISGIERYKIIDDIREKLTSIRDFIQKLGDTKKIEIITSFNISKGVKDQARGEINGLEYIDEIKKICKEKKAILWTDDLSLNNVFASEGLRTTCSRTMLDVLLNKAIISEEDHLHKLVKIFNWNMFFCWFNVDDVIKCAEIYDYSFSEDLKIILESIINEMGNYQNMPPNKVELSNFNVASLCMQRLWLISGKAQSLAMLIFDRVLAAIQSKKLLKELWIKKGIISFGLLSEIVLAEFLRMLSLRMIGQIEDELKGFILDLIKICSRSKTDLIVQAVNPKIVAANIIKAVRIAIPPYADEVSDLAMKLDPTVRALI